GPPVGGHQHELAHTRMTGCQRLDGGHVALGGGVELHAAVSGRGGDSGVALGDRVGDRTPDRRERSDDDGDQAHRPSLPPRRPGPTAVSPAWYKACAWGTGTSLTSGRSSPTSSPTHLPRSTGDAGSPGGNSIDAPTASPAS